MYLHLCVRVCVSTTQRRFQPQLIPLCHTHTHTQPALPSRRTIEHASFARYEWKTRCVRVLWVRVAGGQWGEGGAGGHLLAWVSERKKSLHICVGKQKQTTVRLAERERGGWRSVNSLFNIWCKCKRCCNSLTKLKHNTHTHTQTPKYICMHFTTQLQTHAQQLRGSNARDVNSDGDGDVIVAPFWLLLFLTHWQAASRGSGSGRGRRTSHLCRRFVRIVVDFVVVVWLFYACVGILTFNVRQQLQMLAAMSASSLLLLLLVIQSAAAAHAGGGGGSTLKA